MNKTSIEQRHFFGTLERFGRWISICQNCGAEDDIHDFSHEELRKLAEKRSSEECHGVLGSYRK
jgi:hypothetical protein